jgi:hypothetical protein
MKIEDLIQLLNNRLNEFKLSKDYARMNGDLKRLNEVEKEIIELEDTIFKLNLLIDNSKSALVKEATLSEIITSGSVSVLDEYDITSYATDPLHEKKIMDILSKMGVMDTAEKIDDYIHRKYPSSLVTGEMIMNAASAYNVDVRLMMALMEQDSRFGTVGVAVKTRNPGNIGNDDDGNLRFYDSWQEGVTAVAEWLNIHRVSKINSQIKEKNPKSVATSTPAILESTSGTATSTPTSTPEPIDNSITETATSTPTSTPETIDNSITETATSTLFNNSTSTPQTATSTPAILESTSGTATSTPTSTPEPIDNSITETATSTPFNNSTSTPQTATSTPAILESTSGTATSTPNN